MRRALFAIGLLLLAGGRLCAQTEELPVIGPDASSAQIPPPVYAPPGGGVPVPDYSQSLPNYPPPLAEPPWCESPYRNSAWRIEFAIIPGESHVSESGFGDWEHSGAAAIRIGLGHEDPNGVGIRLQLWAFGQQDVRTGAGDVELDAVKLNFDFYKRLFIDDAEFVIGGGPASAALEYNVPSLNQKARFSGGGISAFGEAYYPIGRWKKTDLGSVARARVSLLAGNWEDDGTPFVDDTDHDMMTIIDLAWGLQLRRRFGLREDKYWYVEFVPEIQRWDSASLSNFADPGFEGTAINFGLAW